MQLRIAYTSKLVQHSIGSQAGAYKTPPKQSINVSKFRGVCGEVFPLPPTPHPLPILLFLLYLKQPQCGKHRLNAGEHLPRRLPTNGPSISLKGFGVWTFCPLPIPLSLEIQICSSRKYSKPLPQKVNKNLREVGGREGGGV